MRFGTFFFSNFIPLWKISTLLKYSRSKKDHKIYDLNECSPSILRLLYHSFHNATPFPSKKSRHYDVIGSKISPMQLQVKIASKISWTFNLASIDVKKFHRKPDLNTSRSLLTNYNDHEFCCNGFKGTNNSWRSAFKSVVYILFTE